MSNCPPDKTAVLITVDTELSASLHRRGLDARANVDRSIRGICGAGAFGIGWQMDQLDTRGLKGVYFVDPMPALIYGEQLVADIVGPIIARGHEVQLHIHTEWLEWASDSPVGGRQGRDLADFSLDDQVILLRLAVDMIERAGAPRPTAFRAGNYGANDDSLRALHALRLIWDSSVNAPYLGTACRIEASPDQIAPAALHGTIELPVSGLHDRGARIRPAQICAISANEMRAALNHAATHRHPAFVIVTHSFEMLSRDRLRPNRTVMDRFQRMCDAIAANPQLRTTGFNDLDPGLADSAGHHNFHRLPPSSMRTGWRMMEQAVATWRFEHRLKPA